MADPKFTPQTWQDQKDLLAAAREQDGIGAMLLFWAAIAAVVTVVALIGFAIFG